MAADATVESSAMLSSRDTGALKEVDVVIRSRQAGHDVIVSVEAVAWSRPADRNWVDKQLGRHADLPTSKLVLVSQSGFTKDARAAALARNAVPIAPDDLTGGDPAGRVVAAVKSLWPKVMTFQMQTFSVKFDDDDAPKDGWPAEHPAVYADDSSRLADTIEEFVKPVYEKNFPGLMEQIGLAGIAEDEERQFILVLGNLRPRVNGVERYACLLNDDERLYSLKSITVVGKGTIQVSEIPLKHGRLGEVRALFSYGEGKVGGRDALIVASTTEGDDLGKLTIRVRPERDA